MAFDIGTQVHGALHGIVGELVKFGTRGDGSKVAQSLCLRYRDVGR